MENKPVTKEKGRYQVHFRGTECLNCGHPLKLSDRFCPNCSQANSTKKLSIKDFVDEFFANYFAYDSKLLRTLSALLLKPGRITRDYINGKRVSYTNPFRFLLSLAIVYFLILGLTGDFDQIDLKPNTADLADFDLKKTLDTIQYENENEKQRLLQLADSLPISNYIDFVSKKDSALKADPATYFSSLKDESKTFRILRKQDFFNTVIKNGSIRTYKDALEKYEFEDSRENQFAFTAGRSFAKISANPGDFLRTMISRLPFAVFFFLPFFTLFIWLVYIRKRFNYTDHLIFSFHNTSLLFILLIISYLVDTIFNSNSNWLFLSIFSVYLFQAMRKFYGQNVFKTIVKYLFLNAIFIILATVSTLILITGNIITY